MTQFSAGSYSPGQFAGFAHRSAPLSDAVREDAASTLAMRAQAGLSRNRPRSLVLGACLVFVCGAALCLHGMSKANAALERTSKAQTQANNTLQALAHLDSLIKRGAGEGPRIEGSSQMLSKIEAAGLRAGYPAPFPVGQVSNTPKRDIGANQVSVRYSQMKHEDLSVLLGWVQTAVTEVPGLEVISITIRPEAEKWSMDVRFGRWERAEAPR
jgi:hypothetical protein